MMLRLLCLSLFTVRAAARATPSPPQLAWHGHFGSIIHYEMATFVGTQGCSRSNWPQSSDAKTFGVGLNGHADTDSWGRAMVAANISYAVYVAKHNCGFITWPTKTKLPDGSPYAYAVQNSSCPECNIVADFLATCKKFNIRPGFYYSLATNTYLNVEKLVVQPDPLPGMVAVTQRQYYDIALAQLEELWSIAPNSLFEVWADGGLPRDPYFGAGITALLAKYQPQVVVFNGFPVINSTMARWIGNEAASAPVDTWSTGSCGRGSSGDCTPPCPNGGDPDSSEWCPAESPATLQATDQWFYIEQHPLNSPSTMQTFYHNTMGHNTNFLLDIAPPPNSTIVESHETGYQALGDFIRGCYGSPLASGTMAAGATTLDMRLPAGARIDRVRLHEDQRRGQLIRAYTVAAETAPGVFVNVSSGKSVGVRRIDLFTPVGATSLQIIVDTPPTGLVVDAFLCEA